MKNYCKRYFAVLLSFALVLAIPMAFTQEASAASGGKKINQPVQITSTSTGMEGVETSTTTVAYNKNGLVKERLYSSDGSRTVYKYSKKGLVKSWQSFDKNGALESEGINTIKKNKIRKTVNYRVENGQKVLSGTTTYKYKKNKLAKETWVSADGTRTSTTTYRKNEKLAKYTYSSPTSSEVIIYDKYGNCTSESYTDSEGTKSWKYALTYKKGKLRKKVGTYTNTKGVVTPEGTTTYKYTKKGLLKSSVYTSTYTDTDSETGTVFSWTDTTTTNYTYTKNGLIKGVSRTYVSTDSNGQTTTSSRTTSIAYKKVKVKSKVLKEVKKSLKEFSEGYIWW